MNRNKRDNRMSRKSRADLEIAEEGKIRSTMLVTFPSWMVNVRNDSSNDDFDIVTDPVFKHDSLTNRNESS